jgi:diaminopimelate epimerase
MARRPKRTIPFHKMSGSGNDFILIDNRANILKGINIPRLVKTICRHRLSVGGDGVILLERPRSKRFDFRWRLFNADGGEAEMSGNGGRCAARLAHLLGIASKKMIFETLAGPVRAEVDEGGGKRPARVKIEMPPPKDLQLDLKIRVEGETHLGHFINSGVPHTVLYVEDLDATDALSLGRAIRHHSLFQPAGTNVNFVTLRTPHRAVMRTYERGVEEETLACGTGAVAAALISGALSRGTSPMDLRQKSGIPLRVHFRWNGREFSDVFLEGDAQLIYSAELQEEAWK